MDLGMHEDGDEKFGQSWRAAIVELAISYAVNHPTRLDCLAILILRVASAKEIARDLELEVSHVAHHLEELRKDGVVEYVRGKTGGQRRGGTERYYRATALPEVTEGDWLKMPHDCRREMAGRVLQAIVAMSLSAIRCQTMERDDNLNLGWQAVPVDEEGEGEVVDLMVEMGTRTTEIKARNKERLEKAGEVGTIRILGQLSFVRADPAEWDGRLKPGPSAS